MMRSNGAPAILALVLALFLWMYVRLVYGGPDTTRMMVVPITLKGTPPAGFDMQLHPDSTRVRVSVKGPENVLKELLPQDIRASVDVAHVNTAKSSVPVEVSIERPNDVTARPLSKATLIVTRLLQETMPVQVSFVVAPPAGTTVGSYIVEPREVTVEARSQQELDAIKYITVAVDPTTPFTAPRLLEPRAVSEDDRLSARVRVLTSTVEVRAASLTGAQTTRRVAVRLPELQHLPGGYDVMVKSVQPDEVTLSGDPAVLARQPAYLETEPQDVRTLRRDETRSARLKVPEGLRVVEGAEVRVDLQVHRQP
jgi:YbbR domain-containing protein